LCALSGPLYLCKDCDLIFRWPRPDNQSLERAYRSIPVNSWSNARPAYWALIGDLIRKHASNENILDIGCFRGDFLAFCGDRYRAFGVEPNPAAAEFAQSRGIAMVGRDINDDLSMYNGQFGAIILMDVLEHVPDPLATLRTVRPLLAPAGIVVVLTGDSGYWLARMSQPFYWYMSFPIHLVYLSRRFIRWAAANASYQVIAYERVAHDPESFRRRLKKTAKALVVAIAKKARGGHCKWICSIRPFSTFSESIEPPRFPELPDHMIAALKVEG